MRINQILISDEDSVDMHYVNLLKNPERYTGYKGNSALKVWQAIYQENCFKPDPKFDKNFLLHPTTVGKLFVISILMWIAVFNIINIY